VFDESTLQQPAVLASLQAVLAGIRDHDDIGDAFDAVDGGDELVELLDGYDGLMLYAPGASSPAVLLQLPEGSWPRVSPSTPVRVIRSDGSSDLTTGGDLSARRDLPFEPGAVVVSTDVFEVDQLPFAACHIMWSGTKSDSATGESDWTVTSNGVEVGFNLRRVRRSVGHVTDAWPGIWFDVQCDGESMSTGEIGITIWSDADGTFWAETWGSTLLYLGQSSTYRPDNAMELLIEALDALDTELWDIRSISSDVLTSDKIYPAVRYLVSCDGNMSYENLEDISVSCADFDCFISDLFELMET
jgi:hypothetical protein